MSDELSIGKDTLKLKIRKLKGLGLTHSLQIRYELSPRGAAYLDALDGSAARRE